ncbi:MAG TPA: hypothetical protein VJT67_10245 [Longimicrobiaceae bacterium]|nr:hypothetical protein [Longimicrobiaceae bacterium]
MTDTIETALDDGVEPSALQRVLRFLLANMLPRDVIETIGDYSRARAGFPNDEELARFLRIEQSEVDDWKKGQVASEDRKKLFRDVAVSVSELEKIYHAEVIPAWLSAKPRGDTKAPIELLWEGNLAEVLQLINASSNAAYS